jgi:hypothetical protein
MDDQSIVKLFCSSLRFLNSARKVGLDAGKKGMRPRGQAANAHIHGDTWIHGDRREDVTEAR